MGSERSVVHCNTINVFLFLQLVLDAAGDGAAGVGQPQVLLPDGRIRFNG